MCRWLFTGRMGTVSGRSNPGMCRHGASSTHCCPLPESSARRWTRVPPLDESDPNADVRGLSLSPHATSEAQWGGNTGEGAVYSEAYPPSIFLGVIEHSRAPLIARLALDQPRRALYQGDHKLVTVGDKIEGLFTKSRAYSTCRMILPKHMISRQFNLIRHIASSMNCKPL